MGELALRRDMATIIDNMDTAWEEARALFARTAQALDDLDDRGCSSQRALARDVLAFRRRMGWALPPQHERGV